MPSRFEILLRQLELHLERPLTPEERRLLRIGFDYDGQFPLERRTSDLHKQRGKNSGSLGGAA